MFATIIGHCVPCRATGGTRSPPVVVGQAGLGGGGCGGTAVSFSDDPRLGTGNGGRGRPGTKQVDQWNDRICLPVPLSHVTVAHQDSGAWAYPDKTRPLIVMDLLPVRGLVGHALMVMIRLRSSPVSSHMTPIAVVEIITITLGPVRCGPVRSGCQVGT